MPKSSGEYEVGVEASAWPPNVKISAHLKGTGLRFGRLPKPPVTEITPEQSAFVLECAETGSAHVCEGTEEGLHSALREIGDASSALPTSLRDRTGVLRHELSDTAAPRNQLAQNIFDHIADVRRFASTNVIPRRLKPSDAGDTEAVFVSCNDIVVRRGHRNILDHVDLVVPSRSVVAVVGANGAGKTTLLRVLALQEPASSGSLEYPALRAETTLSVGVAKDAIAFAPQEPTRFSGTVRNSLLLWAAIRGMPPERGWEIDAQMNRLGLSAFAHHTFGELSAGYRTRFDLARCLLSNPAAIVLDEPLGQLDPDAKARYLDYLKRQVAAHSTLSVVLSSQDVQYVDRVADVIIVIDDGRIVFSGKRSSIGSALPEALFEVEGDISSETKEALRDQFGATEVAAVPPGVTRISVRPGTDAAQLAQVIFRDPSAVGLRDLSNSVMRLFGETRVQGSL